MGRFQLERIGLADGGWPAGASGRFTGVELERARLVTGVAKPSPSVRASVTQVPQRRDILAPDHDEQVSITRKVDHRPRRLLSFRRQPLTFDLTYDYLVVGAGAAGAVLAARLSESPSSTVLLVEAGPDFRSSEAPPAMRASSPAEILISPDLARFRWDDLTACHTEAQEPRPFVRGRGAGGSTSINSMMAVRGAPDDYDGWANHGCSGWSWSEVLPWFRQLEDDLDFGDRPYHGVGGPIPVWRPPDDGWSVLDLALREAAVDEGHPSCPDHNAPDGTGVSPLAANVRHGFRVSTNDGYLEGVRGRPNLTIVGDALVDRVEIHNGHAHAVHILREGESIRVEAGEVILAAGAVHSPSILLRSGVGPSGQLQDLGISVAASLEGVGANLADHPSMLVLLFGSTDTSFEAPNGRIGNCYVRYSSGLGGGADNDMSLISMAPASMPGVPSIGVISVSLWQPFSRGALRLASPDPLRHPLIEERMLSDPGDTIRMRDGMRRVFGLLNHSAVEGLGATAVMLGGGVADRLQPLDVDLSDADLDQVCLSLVGNAFHIVGTCRMGDPADPSAVVDPEGKVIGIDGLRVVDASIMPTCPRANTALTTIMLAEKLAPVIAGKRGT